MASRTFIRRAITETLKKKKAIDHNVHMWWQGLLEFQSCAQLVQVKTANAAGLFPVALWSLSVQPHYCQINHFLVSSLLIM